MDEMDGDTTTLVDAVSGADNLTTLETALQAAGRAQTLDDENATFTVFAPSDTAFSGYDVDLLTSNTDLLGSVLDYHVVQGAAVTSDQLSDGDTFETVAGDTRATGVRRPAGRCLGTKTRVLQTE